MPSVGDAAHRGVQRAAAVAVAGAEHVAGEALAVDPHQRGIGGGDVAADERHVAAVVEHRLEGDELEVAPRRRQRRLADAADELLGLPAVADEVGDGDQQQAVRGAELLQLRAPGHVVLALADDLAQHADRRAAGHPGEVDRRPRCGPARLRTPPSRASSGKMWPGRRRSAGLVAGSTSARIVAARSAAEMPVDVPWR